MEHISEQFDGYTLRSMKPEDRELLAGWIEADPHHAGRLRPEFFIDGDRRVQTWMLENAHGPLFSIRISRAARVHIQFPAGRQERRHVALGLIKGMAYLEVMLERIGVSEWIFDTQSPPLKELAEKRLGFAPSPHEMVRLIPQMLQIPGLNNREKAS